MLHPSKDNLARSIITFSPSTASQPFNMLACLFSNHNNFTDPFFHYSKEIQYPIDVKIRFGYLVGIGHSMKKHKSMCM